MMVKRSMGFSCHQMNKKAGEQMDTMAKLINFVMKEIGAPTIMKRFGALNLFRSSRIVRTFSMENSRRRHQTRRTNQKELADVLIYSYMMADNLGFDLDEIIEEKLKKNALKYPVPH